MALNLDIELIKQNYKYSNSYRTARVETELGYDELFISSTLINFLLVLHLAPVSLDLLSRCHIRVQLRDLLLLRSYEHYPLEILDMHRRGGQVIKQMRGIN